MRLCHHFFVVLLLLSYTQILTHASSSSSFSGSGHVLSRDEYLQQHEADYFDERHSFSSKLLASIAAFEVISIDNEHFDLNHPLSIVQPSAYELLHAKQSKHVYSAQSESPSSPSSSSTMEIAASSWKHMGWSDANMHEPAQLHPRTFPAQLSFSFQTLAHNFSFALQKQADLFHPDYSETRQYWANGVRYRQKEYVRPRQAIEECFYTTHEEATDTPHSQQAIHLCSHGGLSGYIKKDNEYFIIEPARAFLKKPALYNLHEKIHTLGQKVQVVNDINPHSATTTAHAMHTTSTSSSSQQHYTLPLSQLHEMEQHTRRPAAHFHTSSTLDSSSLSSSASSQSSVDLSALSRLHVIFPARSFLRPFVHAETNTTYTCLSSARRTMKHLKQYTSFFQANQSTSTHVSMPTHDLAGAQPTFGHLSSPLSPSSPSGTGYAPWEYLAELIAREKSPTAQAEHQHEHHEHGHEHDHDHDHEVPLSEADVFAHYFPGSNSKTLSPSSSSSSSASSSHASSSAFRPQLITTPVKYVALLVANDNQRYLARTSNTELHTASLVNMIKTTYRYIATPTINVILFGQITWFKNDPYTVSQGTCSACKSNNGVSVDELLSAWNNWRSNPLNTSPYQAHDNGHLFSGFNFETPTLGYANVGGMCTNSISGGINHIRETVSDLFNQAVVSHEMGHNFGSEHDSVNNVCPSSGFIMNAVIGSVAPTNWSSCTLTYISNFISRSYITCLDDQPTTQWGNPVCGNGFIEGNETCDCGQDNCQQSGSLDRCCDGATCQYRSGALCSAQDTCCDASTCLIINNTNTVCREATSVCDVAERCDGKRARCPDDRYLAAGTKCEGGSYGPGLCYAKTCLSLLRQCRLVGATFPNAPYSVCPQQLDFNDGNYCARLWCSAASDSCTYFRQSGQVVMVQDGMPCPNADDDGQLTNQCFSGQCVSPMTVNVNYKWQYSNDSESETGWEACYSCDSIQYRNVSCLDTNYTIVADVLCPPSNKPSSSRNCVNETIGCYPPSSSSGDDIDFFGTKVAKNTIIFSALGAFTLILLIIGCCYQAVTFVGENEAQPESNQGRRKKVNDY